MTKKQKVVVAMSGGVDSSVAAALLLETGYNVAGVSLRLWEYQHEDPKNCSDYRGAEKIAHLLGIPHTLLDSRSEFIREVVQPFARSYLQGSTPNPCVTCNRDFKLGVLLTWAKEQGAHYVATGHYARVERGPLAGRPEIARPVQPEDHAQPDITRVSSVVLWLDGPCYLGAWIAARINLIFYFPFLKNSYNIPSSRSASSIKRMSGPGRPGWVCPWRIDLKARTSVSEITRLWSNRLLGPMIFVLGRLWTDPESF